MNADEEKFVQYDWELEPVSYQLCTSLQSRFQHDPDSLSPATKLSLAFQSSLASTSNEHTFGLLYSTASLGDARAKALISSVYCRTEEFLKREAPDVMQNTVNFLRHAIITGATICFQQLKHLDTIMFEEARSQFHLRGGYNQFYTPESYDDSDPSFEQSKSSRLHWLAAYGTYEEVADYINLQPDHDINSMTATYETPLYLACMRGDLKITKILLQNGADPSIQCGPFDLTGLHWLFAFDENNHQEAACDLIAYGSNIDAYTSCVVPFYHFPFSLPPGTPLHWAITLKNDSAVKTLLALGANALFRNATDPYMWDELVRELNLHGGPNQELYSAFNEDALGLSPLDIASSDRYAYPFQYILQNSPITLNINDRDEEDYTIVHRLGDSFIGSTRLDVTYDKRAFRGSSEYQAKALSETILAIKALGGDLNAFTRQSRLGSTWNAFHHVGRSGLTPLMLSTLVGDLQLATELIKSGADIQRKNEQGMIAVLGIFFGPLFAILTTRKVALDMIKLLSAYGADLKARTPRNGTSILVLAAGSGALDIVEFLLELDVSTDNRYDAMEQYWDHSNNCSFWATLVRPQRYISLKGYLPYDREVCRLLQKYLLAESDVIRRRHLMEDVYRRGWSLLHYYVYHRMPQSTRALLDAGCAVNIVSIGSISAFLGLTERRSFKATPLDIALKAKADTSHKLQGPKMALVDSLYNQIIKTLKDKGAKTLSELQEPTAKPPLEHDFLQI